MDKIKKLRKIGGSVYLLISRTTAQEAGVDDGSRVRLSLNKRHQLLIACQFDTQVSNDAGTSMKTVHQRGGSLYVLIPATHLMAMNAHDNTAVAVSVDSQKQIVVSVLPDDWEYLLKSIAEGS